MTKLMTTASLLDRPSFADMRARTRAWAAQSRDEHFLNLVDGLWALQRIELEALVNQLNKRGEYASPQLGGRDVVIV